MIKVSDFFVKFLEENGVKHIFMLTGGGCMHLVDSIGKSKKIKYICNHHEQSCAMAAEAYAKLKNELSVVLVTSGPGTTNTITGVLGSFQDSVPCLFISGQAKRKQTIYNSKLKLRQFGVQEANIVPIVESITKYAVMVNDPEKIKYHLQKALYLAKTGRPGPVWLDIPLDVQAATVDEKKINGFDAKELKIHYKTAAGENEIAEVVDSLKVAKRPVIIAGRGVRIAGASFALVRLAEKYNIPVVSSVMGIDLINSDHKCAIGKIGTHGTRAGNFTIQNADLILSIGSRLSISAIGHEYDLFAREAKIIVIDIDSEEHKKNTIKIDKFINADAKDFIEKLLEKLESKNIRFSDNWLLKCNHWKKKYPVCLPEYRNSKSINLYYFIEMLNKKIKPEIPIISDAGSSFYVVSQAMNIKKGQRHITSGALATMGFGLPAAIGVSTAIGNKAVATIIGDGSFQQNMPELQIIVNHNLPIKIFVIENKGYLSIRRTQKKFFNGHFVGSGPGSGVSFPSFKKIASAYGIKYIKASYSKDLGRAIDKSFSYKGPIICEIKSLKNQPIIPTNFAEIKPDGTMVSKPLEDMYPFLDRDEFKKEMIIKPLED